MTNMPTDNPDKNPTTISADNPGKISANNPAGNPVKSSAENSGDGPTAAPKTKPKPKTKSKPKISNPVVNPLDDPNEPIQDFYSSHRDPGRKPVRLIILVLAASLIGYALWPKGDRFTPGPAGTEPGVDPVTTAQIYPSPAYATNPLEVRLADRYWMFQDSLEYRWFRNGQAIQAVTGSSLATDYFKKGDEIFVEITLQRQNQPAKTFSTPVTKIQNTPPRIMSATTFVQSPPDQKIQALAQSRDPDGDRLTYRYTWFKNGEIIKDQTGPTLDPTQFTRGDKVYAEIVVGDGEDLSSKKRSAPITFENSPPRISSQPPAAMAPGRRFVYQLQVTDVDGDAINYQLAQSPPGMTISPTGLIEWEWPQEEPGSSVYTVKVVITDDAGGEAVQSFKIATSGVKPDQETEQD